MDNLTYNYVKILSDDKTDDTIEMKIYYYKMEKKVFGNELDEVKHLL